MDLTALVESFATGTYQVTRRATGGYDQRGIARPSTDQQIPIRASVQPATGRDLLRLPEGRRSNETRVLFTTVELMVGDQGEAFEADVVTIDGQPWECQHVENWTQARAQGTAYRCIVQRPTDV